MYLIRNCKTKTTKCFINSIIIFLKSKRSFLHTTKFAEDADKPDLAISIYVPSVHRQTKNWNPHIFGLLTFTSSDALQEVSVSPDLQNKIQLIDLFSTDLTKICKSSTIFMRYVNWFCASHIIRYLHPLNIVDVNF